jgi:hypothetical protein
MKLSAAIIFAAMASASAFTPATNKASFTVLRMSETPPENKMESTPAAPKKAPYAKAPEVPKARVDERVSSFPDSPCYARWNYGRRCRL